MNGQQEKVLGFLNEVYELTKNDYNQISLTSICSKHGLHIRLCVLIRYNFVERKKGHGDGFYYKWKTIKPNLKMVDKCILEIKKAAQMKYLKTKEKLVVSDSKPRLDFVNSFRINFSNDYYKLTLTKLYKSHHVNQLFGAFLIHNDYIIRRRVVGTVGNHYEYKWNDKKSFTELKKLILEADISKKKTQIKKVETKVVEPKQENTIQIQVYENIIRTLNNDLDSKEKQIEELEKKLSLKTKRITKKVEPTQKNITILWGLIKIKY